MEVPLHEEVSKQYDKEHILSQGYNRDLAIRIMTQTINPRSNFSKLASVLEARSLTKITLGTSCLTA